MASKIEILDYIDNYKKAYEVSDDPIFEIYLIQNPDKEMRNSNGSMSGFPDNGDSYFAGFYYDMDDAILALTENWEDINEFGLYKAGFILCKFPGLYNEAGCCARMFFIWDNEIRGYVECEEPIIHSHIAY